MDPRVRSKLVTTLLVVWIMRVPCRADVPVVHEAPASASGPSAAAPSPVSASTTTAAVAPMADPAAPAGQPAAAANSPASEPVKLKAPPLEPSDQILPINLASALRLADARPLIVAAAQASAWVAEAQLQRAKVIWVPELDLAAVYIRHDGFGPDTNRGNNNTPFNLNSTLLPINQNINYFYGGGGLYTVFALTDAIFQPLAAKQVLDSRRWDIQTAKNDALLQTASAYFNVHRSRGTYAGALDVVERGQKLVARIEALSKDLVPRVEVDRSKRLLADLEQEAAKAREAWRIASANLTQVLRLDPRAVVVPVEHDHLQITLVDPARPLDELIPISMRTRPELASCQGLIQASQVRIRQEKLRPAIPTVIITGFQTPGNMRMQAGIFGIGSGGALNNWNFRDDVSLQLAWQLDGMGLGNLARVKEQRSLQSRALVRLYRTQDAVAAEVTQAQASLQSAAVRVLQAERSLRQAVITFDGNYGGLQQTQRFKNILVEVYRPQEVVKSLESLKVSYDEYFATVAEYNQAQFRMFHALGYPAQEVASYQPVGEALPVDVTRPGYMPAVGTGPPPATR